MQVSLKKQHQLQQNSEQFLTLFEPERRRIYAYIYAFVMDKAAADDIFQETSTILWREFEHFELGTSFTKWSNAIVFNCVRTYRRNRKKLVTGFSDELIEELVENTSYDDTYEKKWRVLQQCQSQLADSAQQIYHGFYIRNESAQSIADKTGRSIYAVRKSIHKIRKKLFDCVDSKKQG